MPAQPFSHRRGRTGDERSHIRHTLAPLLTKKGAVALHKLDQQPLNLALKIGGCHIDTAEDVEIERTQERPHFLAFATIYRAHP
jgi:hypothetical protein